MSLTAASGIRFTADATNGAILRKRAERATRSAERINGGKYDKEK